VVYREYDEDDIDFSSDEEGGEGARADPGGGRGEERGEERREERSEPTPMLMPAPVLVSLTLSAALAMCFFAFSAPYLSHYYWANNFLSSAALTERKKAEATPNTAGR
jgi:hypothetical protein